VVLFYRLTAGDALPTGTTVVRNSIATFLDALSVVGSVVANALRDNHWIAGIRTALIESLSQNSTLQSNDLTGAVWNRTNTIATKNATGPDGVANSASTLAETNGVQGAYIVSTTTPVPVTPSAVQAFSVDLKPNGRTTGVFYLGNGPLGADRTGVNFTLTGAGSVVDFSAGAGTVPTFKRITLRPDGYYTLEIAGVCGAQPSLVLCVRISAGTGDGVSGFIVANLQHEVDKARPSSRIPTTTVAVQRPADVVTIPGVNTGGATATLYQKYYDLATAAWVEVVTPYTSSAALPRVQDRAYALDKIALGTRTLAEMQAL
jgi:hypothetical protein